MIGPSFFEKSKPRCLSLENFTERNTVSFVSIQPPFEEYVFVVCGWPMRLTGSVSVVCVTFSMFPPGDF